MGNIVKSSLTNQLGFANTTVNLRSSYSTSSRVLKKLRKDEFIGTVVGYFKYKRNGYTWYAFQLANPIAGNKFAYVAKGYFNTKKPTVTKDDALKLVNNLAKSDTALYKYILVIGAQLSRLEKTGVDITNQKKVYVAMLKRYSRRQGKMRDTNALQVSSFIDSSYNYVRDLAVDWARMQYGIGAVQFIPVAVAAIIGGAITIALYYQFKPDYDESQVDLKVAGQFKKFLEKLPESTQTEIKKDLEKQIDDAYNQGKSDGVFSGMFTMIKPVLIGGVAIWGFTKLMDNSEQWRYKQTAIQPA